MMKPIPRSLVINFNSPELNYLALALAENGSLCRYVRPYINKGRVWERVLGSLPMLGKTYEGTFGRRRIRNPQLAGLTQEAGIFADIGAAVIGRMHSLPEALRLSGSYRLQESVRHAVARRAARLAPGVECVVAYVGFGLPAFEAVRAHGAGKALLNYPIAHHRHHRKLRQEEQEREPEFASTWPSLDGWATGYEAQIDQEIEVADIILVGSSYARDSFVLEGVAPEKIVVAPYGVDLNNFSAAPPRSRDTSKQFEVIFVGQLSQRKGISYLLRGYRRFRKSDTRLTVVGNTPGSMAPFKPYADLFRHVPHQTRPALAQMYRDSDVFVFPTLLEGMPLVVLEAMACGLPVIVTANGPGDIVRDGIDGFVVPSRDEEAIGERLERLYRDPELRAEMGRNACARAHEFSWAAYANRTFGVLASLINAPDRAVA